MCSLFPDPKFHLYPRTDKKMETPFPPNYWSIKLYSLRKHTLPLFLILAFSFSEVNEAIESERMGALPLCPQLVKWRLCTRSTENTGVPISFSQKAPNSTAMVRDCQEKADQEKQRDQSFPCGTDLGNLIWSSDMLHWLSKSLFIGWKKKEWMSSEIV